MDEVILLMSFQMNVSNFKNMVNITLLINLLMKILSKYINLMAYNTEKIYNVFHRMDINILLFWINNMKVLKYI